MPCEKNLFYKKKKAVLGVIVLFLFIGSFTIISVRATSNDTTLIFAESFNQDLSRWDVFIGPYSNATIQNTVYNSSPMALLINTSDYLSCLVHDLTPVNASYTIELLLYPADVSFRDYGVLTLLDGKIPALTLELENFSLYVNGLNATTVLSEYWNTITVTVNQTTATLDVNGVEIGGYPCSYTQITAVALGSPLDYAKSHRVGQAFFDDLKIYITPIQPPQQQQESEPINVVNIVLVAVGIGVIVVGIVAFLFGRLYFMGRRVESR